MPINEFHQPHAPGQGFNRKRGIGSMGGTTSIIKSPVEKGAVEKTAAGPVQGGLWPNPAPTGTVGKALANGVVGSVAFALATGAGFELFNRALSKIDKVLDKPEQEKAFNRALMINPKLQSFDQKLLREYFGVVREASPMVAKSPLILANYLQYMMDHEGSMNFMAFKQLVDLEGGMAANEIARVPMGPMTQKAVVEGVIRSQIPQMQARTYS